MKRTRHTPEQIVRKLPESYRLLAENTSLADVLGTSRSHTRPISTGELKVARCVPMMSHD